MWTPKRVVLGALGAVVFLASFLVYTNYLGGVDGLPPLPEKFWPRSGNALTPPRPRGVPAVVKRLEEAFGRDCPEARLPIKIEVAPRGFAIASQDFFIEKDGRVRLVPLSIALFGKSRGEDGTPEINTIRADEAYLTFERPITTLADIGKYRIVEAQLSGKVKVINNRRTPHRDDDLILWVARGPVFYRQRDQLIWTDDFIEILDTQSKPLPTKITGQGLEVELVADNTAGKPGQTRTARRQIDNITGVKRIVLKSTVLMYIHLDGKTGFLGGRTDGTAKKNEKTAGLAGKPAESSSLTIKTHGRFEYDLLTDLARFDIPPEVPGQTPKMPEHVEVYRVHNDQGKKQDSLICKKLELQFRRKEAAAPQTDPNAPKGKSVAPAGRSLNLQVEAAHASGEGLALASEVEDLVAYGNDLHYDGRTSTTTLKGRPMHAINQGNEIRATELHIRNADEGQSAVAIGPGKMTLRDSSRDKRPVEAQWKDKLVSSKDGELDLIHLTGEATFIDAENNQSLRADDLKVWLAPPDRGPVSAEPVNDKTESGKEKKDKPTGSSPRPDHVVATGKVQARSKEFNLRGADRFVVWFKDVPASPTTAPVAPPVRPGPRPPSDGGAKPGADPNTPQVQIGKPGSEAKQPIDLTARSVETHVFRDGRRTQLHQLKSEGKVCVTQEPTKPGEKGVKITGEKLQLTSQPEGNVLVVTGDLAELHLDKLTIIGPEVNIDQAANKAWVNGDGAMTMESDTDFQGNQLKQATPLTIQWHKSMYFNGKFAEFHGNIQADQGHARLACQWLQVFFDRPVSLRQGERNNGQRARVRNLVCDRDVRVEDGGMENGEWTKYYLLTGHEIAFDNEDGVVQSKGPGEVRLMQRGSEAPSPAGAPKQPAPARKAKGGEKEDEMKLTYVSYAKQMYGNNQTQTVKFHGNVRVLHFPCDNPRAKVDLEQIIALKTLPAGAIYMRCDQLKVCSRQREGAKPLQEMEALYRVEVESREFSGKAHRVIYDEEGDRVIFDGGEGGTATLYKKGNPGESPKRVEGKKIIYERRTGRYTGDQIRTIEGQ